MQLLLPNGLTAQDIYLSAYVHPRTAHVAKFVSVGERIYELTKVGSHARSAIIGASLRKDASLCVATAIHPLFFLLRPLFENQGTALPLEIILELGASEDADSFPSALAEKHITNVCDKTASGLYKLNLQLLKGFLDKYADALAPVVPEAVRRQVVRTIQPIDPREAPRQELISEAHRYAAVSFMAASWLSATVREWFYAQQDFSRLETAAAELHRLHVEAQAHQYSQLAYLPPGAAQRSASVPNSKQPKTKRKAPPPAPNNSSILDMFQKRPAKKSRSVT